MYDQVATAEIVLMNTGMVGFEFTALGMDPGMASKPKPGVPVMIPHTVSVDIESPKMCQSPNSSKCIMICNLLQVYWVLP